MDRQVSQGGLRYDRAKAATGGHEESVGLPELDRGVRSSNIAPMKTIVLKPSAAKALDKLSSDVRDRIGESLHAYAIVGTGNVKAMTGAPTVRLRVGDIG